MGELIDSFEKSIFDNFKEPLTDIGELVLDEINDFETIPVLKEIPIIKLVLASGKTVANIRERHLSKKLALFIQEFNNDKFDEDTLIAYRSTIENNERKCQRDAERVLIYLDGYKESEKSTYLARIYKAYINKKINEDEFLEFAELLDRLFTRDLIVLKKIVNERELTKEEGFIAERIHSYGLIGISNPFSYSGTTDNAPGLKRGLSVIGYKFYDVIFNV